MCHERASKAGPNRMISHKPPDACRREQSVLYSWRTVGSLTQQNDLPIIRPLDWRVRTNRPPIHV
jgi:hypothetical protein